MAPPNHLSNTKQEPTQSQALSQEMVEAFASLFKGRTDCWGKISTPTGKCIYETVTLEHYRRHLEGKVSLGIYFVCDDHTCRWFTVDLDQKDFNLAKAIRDELTKNDIPAYISESKRGRYHIHGFAEERFVAKEIRRVLYHILEQGMNLKIKPGAIEIFPKQDYHQPDSPPSKKYPDGKRYPGSYLNLPCFGYSRPFLAGDLKEVPLEVALERIKRVPQEAIDRILKTLPKEKTTRKERAKSSDRERPERSDEFNGLAVEKLLENCSFIQYCQDNTTTLSEPWWWSMCDILSFFGEPGKGKAHELSEPYRKYTREETDKKLEYAKEAVDKNVGPHTCKFVEQDLGFSCPEACLAKKWNLKSPVVLATRLARFGNLPRVVVTNRFLREKTADTIAAVEQANKPPDIFERSGSIVRIARDEFGAPYIETLTESACRGFLERAASYVRVNDKGETIPLPAPPLDIVRDYMSLPNRNLPALLNVTEIPVLRSDGSVVTAPGYDEVSRLYYQPAAGLAMPMVSDNPSQKQLEAAITLIQEPILDFPFDSEASRTNALAVLVTPIYRPMIASLVPLCLIDKPQPGTGAGLLSDVIAIIATGRPAVMMAPPKTDEECEKRLASILLHGQAIITFDNMDGYLYFPSLAMLLTTTTFQTRILGQSKEVRLPNRASYIITGNNIKLGGDMPRRCYLSRMDAREARPWMRDPKAFKYQRLIEWVKKNRSELLAAILTIARSWIAAGKPIPEGLPPLGGFEEWTDTIGGILTHAGFTDFLGNLEFMYQKADVETPQWEGFFTAWQEKFGGEAVTTSRVVESINEHGVLAEALPDTIDRDPKKINRSLSHSLARRTGVRYPNGLMVTKSEKMVHHTTAWQVINYRQEPEKEGIRGISSQNLSSYKSDRGGGLGGLPYRQRSYASKSEEEEIYKSGLAHNPPNPPLATGQIQKPNPPFSNDLWAGMPDYPKEPCPACGGSDFWPDFKGKRFICSRCHPKPQEIDMEV